MKQQLKNEILQSMLGCLDNAQLQELQRAVEHYQINRKVKIKNIIHKGVYDHIMTQMVMIWS